MDIAETLRPILQHEAEQLVLAVQENLLHAPANDDRFRWLRRKAISETITADVSETAIRVSAAGSGVLAEEHGSPSQLPAPFLRPALSERIAPLRQAIGARISHAIAETLAGRR